MVSLERLYELYNIINDAKDSGSKHESEYEEILSGVKGNSAERRLSSQFIAKFFPLFPNLQEQALNSQFDLCEDTDISVRKQAIKDLPSLCKDKNEIIPKVADILAQLLQMEDQAEIITIQNALTALFKYSAKATLVGLFYQIEHSEDETVRDRCLKFLHSKIKSLGSEVFNAESEELIVKESKTVLQDASEEGFLSMMGILKELNCSKTLKGYQNLVDLVAEQCNLTQPMDPTDIESMHRLSSCLKEAIPFFSSQIRSTPFVNYMYKEVMPYINQLEKKESMEDDSSSSLPLDLLKIMAELILYAGELEETAEKVATVFERLLESMPLPPEGEAAAESIESGISLEFSRVECLLFIFHNLAKNHPEFLTDNAERLKDFRVRLQYFARCSQAYQKKLRESLVGLKGAELKTEENSIKMIALKTTENISLLIKDLFHQPPSYKSSVTLSWVAKGKKSMSNGVKRHTPITFDSSPNKSSRNDRPIYAPPRDKYSKGAGSVGRGRGRSFGASRGGYRGRGGSFRGNFKKY